MYKYLKEQIEEIRNREIADDIPLNDVIEDATDDIVVADDVKDGYDEKELEAEIQNDTEEKLDKEIQNAEFESNLEK